LEQCKTPILTFNDLVEARFIERPNRFIALIKIGNKIIRCHIHDPGRLTELTKRGARVLIRFVKNIHRKTNCDVMAFWKNSEWIFTNSMYHSVIAQKLIERNCIEEIGNYREIIREYKYNASKLDFLIITERDEKVLIEVKGCTLFKRGAALFP